MKAVMPLCVDLTRKGETSRYWCQPLERDKGARVNDEEEQNREMKDYNWFMRVAVKVCA
jgi:hypothetical protein